MLEYSTSTFNKKAKELNLVHKIDIFNFITRIYWEK